ARAIIRSKSCVSMAPRRCNAKASQKYEEFRESALGTLQLLQRARSEPLNFLQSVDRSEPSPADRECDAGGDAKKTRREQRRGARVDHRDRCDERRMAGNEGVQPGSACCSASDRRANHTFAVLAACQQPDVEHREASAHHLNAGRTAT